MKQNHWAYLDKIPGGIAPKTKVRVKSGKYAVKGSPLEKDVQGQVEEYLAIKGLSFVRVPDSVYKYLFTTQSTPMWVRKEAQKYMKGQPDLIILKRRKGLLYALPLELKREGITELIGDQEKIQREIGTVVGDGFDNARKIIDEWEAKIDGI